MEITIKNGNATKVLNGTTYVITFHVLPEEGVIKHGNEIDAWTTTRSNNADQIEWTNPKKPGREDHVETRRGSEAASDPAPAANTSRARESVENRVEEYPAANA